MKMIKIFITPNKYVFVPVKDMKKLIRGDIDEINTFDVNGWNTRISIVDMWR